MLTTSEIAVTVTIWSLTACGLFFGTRAALRKRRMKRNPQTPLAQPEQKIQPGDQSE